MSIKFCRVCSNFTHFEVFQKNGFKFLACQACGDAGSVDDEESA